MTTTTEGVRFLIVGAWNTLFGYALFALLEVTAGHVVPYMVILVIAQLVSTLMAYVLYRYLVFRVRGRFWRELARFATVYLAAFVINLVVLPLLVSGLGWNVLVAQGLIVGMTAIGSFFAHRNFSFRRRTLN